MKNSSSSFTRPLLSWAFYDFANTIFSAIVLTVYFPLYFTGLSGSNRGLGLATTLAMLLSGILTPFLGSMSDRTGRTKRYLARSTLVCVLSMALLSLSSNLALLFTFFIFACVFYHASLVFYNSLLVSAAASEKNQAWASGLGTGLGYLGVVFSLPLAHLADKAWGRPSVFWLGALLFLIFALPLFAFVPERTVARPVPFSFKLWHFEWQKMTGLLKHLPEKPALLLFLGGNFFAVDALNAMIFWFSVYAREVFGPSPESLIRLILGLNASAFACGIVAGLLCPRIGAMRVLLLAALSLTLCAAGLALSGSYTVFSILALSLGAFAISGIWTASRKVLIELAPADEIGSYFGLYGLTTKISIIGNLVFSVLADLSGFRVAVAILCFPASAGFLLLAASAWVRKRSEKNSF